MTTHTTREPPTTTVTLTDGDEHKTSSLPTHTLPYVPTSSLPITTTITPSSLLPSPLFSSRRSLRILAVGHTGAGKSNALNQLVGERIFESKVCAGSITSRVQAHTVTSRDGEQRTVIDTPGVCDTRQPAEFVERSLGEAVMLAGGSADAIVVVVAMSHRMTREVVDTLRFLFVFLFPGVAQNAMILFTHDDVFDEERDPETARRAWVETWRSSDEGKQCLDFVSNRYIFFRGKASGTEADRQREEVWSYIRTQFPVPYTTSIFREAQSSLQKDRERAEYDAKAPDREREEQKRELAQLQHTIETLRSQPPRVIHSSPLPPTFHGTGGGGGRDIFCVML